MKIVVICEGATEAALRSVLGEFLTSRSGGKQRTGVKLLNLKGKLLREKLGTLVDLQVAAPDVAGVIALTDVYPAFKNAKVAKAELTKRAGGNHDGKFRAHAAQFELEAWLLPHWDDIAKKLGVNAKAPGANPEQVNGQKPPSHHLDDLFRRAKGNKDRYEKGTDAARWLTQERLERSAKDCPELRAFLNSLLEFAGAAALN